MGASWRPGAAALLLVLAAALVAPGAAAQPAHINLSAVYQFEDPADDVAVDRDPVVGQIPLGEADFSGIDVTRVYVYEDTGPAGDAAPTLAVLIQASGEADLTANYTVAFTVAKGPSSLPSSTASGRGFNFTATPAGTQARLSVPVAQLGAVGGDLLAGLRVTATRTDLGTLPVSQDDQTGTDLAPDAGMEATAYTFFRAAQPSLLDLQVVSVDGMAGSVATVRSADEPVPVVLRITNLGLDADAWGLSASSQPPLADPPVFTQAFTAIAAGATATTSVDLSLAGMAEGLVTVTFTLTSERGATATAAARITLDLPSAPPADRETKPAGLTFLTGAAEAMGFDGPFASYAELALLALLVLLVILAIFLLLALGRTSMTAEATAEAPWPPPAPRPSASAGPAGIAETVRAGEAPAALFAAAAPPPADPEPELDAAALAAAFAPEPDASEAAAPVPAALPTAPAATRIRIDEVRHTPKEPDAGQAVTTEVILRNDGPTTSLRVTLSVDGKPAAERTVQVAARATKSVELPWTAGPGDNRVRIQAFPA